MRYNEHIFKSRMHLKGTILYVVMFKNLRKQIKLKVHTSTGHLFETFTCKQTLGF